MRQRQQKSDKDNKNRTNTETIKQTLNNKTKTTTGRKQVVKRVKKKKI